MTDRTPHGGRVIPRDHGDDIPVAFSPAGRVGDYTVTAAEAAVEVGVSRDTVDTWVRRKQLRPIPGSGRPRRFWMSDVYTAEARRRVHWRDRKE
ncbi:helix-turn-helix domain-containing protein [Nocardiopsis ganjiahuensis]|uniref:helix-turn-helix domain-containing protein n=1 Tax=Nocardiopsis ganjiahuensis TaxID=239984 RepID=UPI000349A6CD|nr:helix-turn-helix domain-containing protein [Nocardiopsis ganjiahuensis]